MVNLRNNPEREENFDEDTARDWRTVQFKSLKCKVLEINKESKNYSNKRLPGTCGHLNSLFLIEAYPEVFAGSQFSEDFSDSELVLIETVKSFCQSIHLFGLSH